MLDSQRYPWNINLSKVYDSSVCSISARNSEATFVEKQKIKMISLREQKHGKMKGGIGWNLS